MKDNIVIILNKVWLERSKHLWFQRFVSPTLANMIVNMPKKYKKVLDNEYMVLIFRTLVLLELFGIITRQKSYQLIGKTVKRYASV